MYVTGKLSFESALFAHIASHDPDIIFGCESKLDNQVPTRSSFPDGYNVYRKERQTGGGGGVFLMVRSTIPSTLGSPTTSTEDDESIWVRVHSDTAKDLHLCSFYKPPNAPVSRLDYLSQSLHDLHHANKKSSPSIVVAGDFNLGNIDWSADPPISSVPATASDSTHLLDLIDDHALTQHVTVPTRPESQNILDLVLSSSPNLVRNTDTSPGISDHDIVTFDIDMKPQRTTSPPHKVYLYNKMDMGRLRSDISKLHDEFLLSFANADVDSNWNLFKTRLLASINESIPSKMTKSKVHLPWISTSLKRQMRKRDKLLRKAKKIKSPKTWCVYKQHRNKVTKAIKVAHNDYLNNVIGENLESNPKKFWSYVKKSRSDGSTIPTLIGDDRLYISNKSKANAFNTYFKSVFTHDDGNLPSLQPSSTSPIGHITFDIEGVQKELQNLNVNKAGGPDGIPNRVLRDFSVEIAPILTLIFQQSFNTGSLPKDWSMAMVSPIFKAGDKSKPCNYRPVSLTCVSCKIMEHIVLSHLNRYISLNNIISDLQHGFRRGFSCETQLVLSFHDWMSTLNNKGQVDAILLDFSKAFDKVSHPKLLLKLQSYGIQGKTLDWIQAFLSNRCQYVSVNGVHSDIESVTSGVPQGSVLGPTLFLIFINDIVEQTSSNVRLFADDCVAYRQIKSSSDHDLLNSDIDSLSSWANQWQMTFNTSKCKLLSITNKRSPSSYTYCLGNAELDHVYSHKYLGVTCNSKMSWGDHVSNIASKANKTLGIVRRTLKPCSMKVKSRAYMSLVRPQLEYASAAWNPYQDKWVNKLEQVQKNAARFVTGNYLWSASSSGLVESLGWPTLEQRRLLSSAALLFKLHKNASAPKIPQEFVRQYRFTRRHSEAYRQPQSQLDAYTFSFFPRTIRLWNSLPTNVIQSPSLDIFRSRFIDCYSDINIPSHLKRF